MAFATIPLAFALLALLLWITFEPILPAFWRRLELPAPSMPAAYVSSFEIPVYTSILVPLDHTDGDRAAVAHAAAIAREHHAKIYLLHIEEDVTSQVYGSMSSTAEVERDRQYLDNIAEALREQGVEVEAAGALLLVAAQGDRPPGGGTQS